MPVPQIPAHGQHQWVGAAGGLRQAIGLLRQEPGLAIGGGKAMARWCLREGSGLAIEAGLAAAERVRGLLGDAGAGESLEELTR